MDDTKMIADIQATVQKIASEHATSGAWQTLSTLLWIVAIAVAVLSFRQRISALLDETMFRLRAGAAVKVASFELGQSYVRQGTAISRAEGSVMKEPDVGGLRWEQRRKYYEPSRNIHLVHKISPSRTRGQLYDVVLYLVSHPRKGAWLSVVQEVRYYFGKHWGRTRESSGNEVGAIFTSIDRARAFAISTSAFGPFMCTAEIKFADGTVTTVNRYVDFEMGGLPPDPL